MFRDFTHFLKSAPKRKSNEQGNVAGADSVLHAPIHLAGVRSYLRASTFRILLSPKFACSDGTIDALPPVSWQRLQNRSL